tara:strand:- start:26748 stop:27551 length:804 start_codon:yes stop_codon:yes gene_type:complete
VPIVYFNDDRTNPYECLPAKLSFEQLPFENKAVVKKTSKGAVQFGRNLVELKEYIAGVLSLAGMVYGSDVRSVTIVDKSLELTINGVKKSIIEFDELVVFNGDLIRGLEMEDIIEKPLRMVDECKVTTKKHDTFLLYGEHDLAERVIFTKHNRLLAESHLDQLAAEDFEYSITSLKYTVKDMVLQSKLPYFVRGLEVEHINRRVYNEDINIYKEREGVVYDHREIEEFCKKNQEHILAGRQEGTETPHISQDAYHCQIHRTISDLTG